MIITVLMITFVGVMVTGTLKPVADTMQIGASPTTCTVNSTMWNTLYNNTYSSFNLTVIIPIVIGAALLLIALLYCTKRTI